MKNEVKELGAAWGKADAPSVRKASVTRSETGRTVFLKILPGRTR